MRHLRNNVTMYLQLKPIGWFYATVLFFFT